MPPDLSVIIPVYNRGEVIRYTLESVRRASVGLNVETIIVDDGSSPPTAELLARLGWTPTRLIRQANQGLLFARLAGLAHATGRNVLFLDSDDLVGSDKFRLQLTAMDTADAQISYTDTARCTLEGDYDSLTPTPDAPARETTDGTEFCIVVQPAPHSPIFRTAWLQQVVGNAFIPPSPLYNSVAEIWFYHNAAPHRSCAIHVPRAHSIIGRHPGIRLTDHWEKLGVASLAVMEAFARHCPDLPESARARRLVGEKAFRSWRALPRDFSPEFSERLVGLWRRLAPGPSPALGGRGFQALSRLTGPERAARMLRRFQAGSYKRCRTMSDTEFAHLLHALPPP